MAYQLPAGLDACLFPIAVAPQGQPNNLVDPQTPKPTIIVVSTITMALAINFSVGRLYVNRSKLKLADCRLLALALLHS
jgi:hypothetical protein